MVFGLRPPSEEGDVFHLIYWINQDQRCIYHYSYGREILECADGGVMEYEVKNCAREFIQWKYINHTIQVESKGLLETKKMLHKGRDYRLRQTV